MAEIRDGIGQDGLLLLTIFLSIVFMVPVSIPGVSTVFGGSILLIGVSRLLGRTLWLPQRIAKRALPAERLQLALIRGCGWLHRLERVSRPHRLGWLASGGPMDAVNNGALVAGAVLLMAPFGFVPFSNTLPALALLFLSIGLLQRDGCCVLLGHGINVASVLYFSVLIAAGSAAVREAFRRLVDMMA